MVDWRYVKLAIGLGIIGFTMYMLMFGTPALAPAATTTTETSGRYRELIREAVEKYLSRPVIT